MCFCHLAIFIMIFLLEKTLFVESFYLVLLLTWFGYFSRFVIRIFQRTVFPDDIVKAQLWEKSQHTRRDSSHSIDTQDTGDIISSHQTQPNGQRSSESEIRIRNGGSTQTTTTITQSQGPIIQSVWIHPLKALERQLLGALPRGPSNPVSWEGSTFS